MGSIKHLIEFLRLHRRAEEEQKKEPAPETEVNLAFLDKNENYNVNKNIFETDFNKYKRIFHILQEHDASVIYMWEATSGKKFFVKTSIGKYCNLLDQTQETIPPQELTAAPIEFDYSSYIYDTEKDSVVILANEIKRVVLFSDRIRYNPSDEFMADFSDGETLQYSYDDETSLSYSILNALSGARFGGLFKALYPSDKIVTLRKDDEKGTMYLIPRIYYRNSKYFLKYEFWKPTQEALEKIKKIRPFYEVPHENTAISLEFGCKYALMMFLNETIFSQPNFDFFQTYTKGRREEFKADFSSLILEPLKADLLSGKTTYTDTITTIYYLHESLAPAIGTKILFFLMESALLRDNLINFSTKEEDIFIKIMRMILLTEGQEQHLMEWLNQPMTQKGKTGMKFEFIYDRIQGDNFMKFAKLISQAWGKTRFIYPDTEKNPEFATTDGLLFLPYTSEKTLGFYFSNVSMSFETYKQNSRLIKTKYETGNKRKVTKVHAKGGVYDAYEEIVDEFWYHPFYPVYLKDIAGQETDMKLDSVVPAFMLKANQEKQFWDNVITTAEYAADILTTVSGVGNIAKFRYLAKFATKAGKLSFVSKAGRAVAVARKAVAGTAAIVEITSGTVGAFLKLTGARDSAWGKALSEYLFWLELLSLSGELTVAIHNGLRKSAKKLVEKPEDAADLEKQLDNLVEERIVTRKEADELLEHLDEIAQADLMAKPSEIGKLGGKILSASQIRKLRGELKRRGVLLLLEEDLKIKSITNQYKKIMLNGMAFESPQDLFFYMKREGFAGAFDAKTKQLFLSEKSTELVAFHEKVHLQHFEELGEAYHSLKIWEKETYVFEKIWLQKHLWTKEEIRISLNYANRERKRAGINPLKMKL